MSTRLKSQSKKKQDIEMKVPKRGKNFIYGEEKYRVDGQQRIITWIRYDKEPSLKAA